MMAGYLWWDGEWGSRWQHNTGAEKTGSGSKLGSSFWLPPQTSDKFLHVPESQSLHLGNGAVILPQSLSCEDLMRLSMWKAGSGLFNEGS